MMERKDQRSVSSFIIIFFFLLFLISFHSCNKVEKETFLDNLQSRRNVFKICKTEFFYKKNRLYKMNIPEPSLHDSFISYSYFIIKGKKIYEISILNSCYQNYLLGNYVLNDTLSNSLTNCSINFLPVIDFSLKNSDSLKFDKKHWTMLEKKILLENDTIYKFLRNFGSEDRLTIIFATKREGFVGVYDSIPNHENIINPIGMTFKKVRSINKFKTEKLKFDLDIFKEFKKE